MSSPAARRGVAGAALLVQAAVLFAPRAPQVDTGPDLPLDKVVHACVFAAATWSVIWAGAPRGRTVVAMAAYAPLSELIQHYLLPDRSGEVADIAANLFGVGVGAALAAVTGRRAAQTTAPGADSGQSPTQG